MKHISLAAKYRPQCFADVVGQQLTTTALSRAAREQAVAPAYLLSGTRGVGKTTIARIFSKALNCHSAPVAEPCNTCAACQRITAGNYVDVAEIDGASNTSVEDVRGLRENIGYMPMDGRYKIFIIDEAHMLSKSAFNALLKTLEEPPSHTVFIFATTEVHRFPATIVSRCQHFVFRSLPQDLIAGHMKKILQKEEIPFEENAVSLIARRAAGSVRDSLSLLDQALALSGRELTGESVRQGLGLAGQDFFAELFRAIPAGDCGAILGLSHRLLEAGVDLGFFTRELSVNLRNLFLYKQQGDKILPALALAPDDQAFVRTLSQLYTAPHLHAAWQMTLENQRSITQSPEPGAALEMLLINLALLPGLLPVGKAPSPPPEQESKKKTVPEEPERASADDSPAAAPTHTWQDFCDYCSARESAGEHSIPRPVIAALSATFEGRRLKIGIASVLVARALEKPLLNSLLQEFFALKQEDIEYVEPPTPLTPMEAMEACRKSPQFQLCEEILGASLIDCEPSQTSTPASGS